MSNFRTEYKSIESLMDLDRNHMLRFDPPYQRDVIWPDSYQIDLIGSIFTGFPIPPITLVKKPKGGYIVLDGKQRLFSIK